MTGSRAERFVRIARRVPLALVLAIVLVVVTRGCTRWPETYIGGGNSMEPTVRPGDYFTVGPVGELRRGMLVMFRFLHEDDTTYHVLRRLAGLPGDSVAMRAGRVIVNGAAMDWPYQVLEPRASRSEMARVADLYDWGPLLVPADSVYLLADTRDIVGWPDSRFLGPVAIRDLVGEAGRYLWSRDRGRILRKVT